MTILTHALPSRNGIVIASKTITVVLISWLREGTGYGAQYNLDGREATELQGVLVLSTGWYQESSWKYARTTSARLQLACTQAEIFLRATESVKMQSANSCTEVGLHLSPEIGGVLHFRYDISADWVNHSVKVRRLLTAHPGVAAWMWVKFWYAEAEWTMPMNAKLNNNWSTFIVNRFGREMKRVKQWVLWWIL